MAEFLPLCDVLFNVISLAGYFCDVVFDVVMGYALLERGYKGTFAAAISIVLTSLLVSQILSLRWYLHVSSGDEERKGKPPWVPILLHCFQLGVLWRYAKLFVPVDLRNVKHEVRDLCMLRLVHAFCEAAPMLLLQIHVLFEHESITSPVELITRDNTFEEPPAGSVAMTANKAFAELNVISASLSMFSVCWALASFSKNVRQQNVHRLVLTWLGVIFQFLWRLGTISARICALSAYALVYKYWIFLVIGLHWVSMFLWLISPKNVFHGERISHPRKAYLSALIAFVYVFAYINLQELNHRQKMVTFYSVMLLENCVLIFACACAWPLAAACFGASAAGLMFMALYYRYFHVRRLGYTLGENQQGTNSTNASSQSKHANKAMQADNAAIPGVFNCRFTNPVGNNSSNGRKRKKPSSFVPPPAPPPAAFWRTPLPHVHHGGSSENEGSSVGSRVNIQQKLQEKKQKQLAELRIIEEEFKQGKLTKTTPVPAEEIYCSLQRQPIPRSKTHADPPACLDLTHPYQNYPIIPHNCNINYPQNESKTDIQIRPIRLPNNSLQFYDNTTPDIQRNILTNYLNENSRNVLNGSGREKGENGGMFEGRYNYGELSRRCVRCRTPEVLLAPHYLDCGRPVCCHWGSSYNRKKEEGEVSSGSECVDPTPRPHSDIESQISLPRSYTLPREFRYWRRRTRREDRERSNNSSDGDVDSAGDNDSDGRSLCSDTSQVPRLRTPERRNLCGLERARRLPYSKHAAKPQTKL